MTRFVFLAFVLTATAAGAQPTAGDYVVATGLGTTQLFAYSPTGQVVWTFGGLMPGIDSVTMAPNNRDLIATTSSTAGSFLVTITPSGSVSTLTQLPAVGARMIAWRDGSYRIPFATSFTVQILTIDASGRVATIVPVPAIPTNGHDRHVIAEDVTSGDTLVVTHNQNQQGNALYRLNGSGTSRRVSTLLPGDQWPDDAIGDARTGGLVYSAHEQLFWVDPISAASSILFNDPYPQTWLPGISYDRQADAWVCVRFAPGNPAWLFRVDRTRRVSSLTSNVPDYATDVEVYGRRHVSATTAPQPGATFPLHFSELKHPGALYVAAASFATRPGLATIAGIVDLATDDLLRGSLSGAPLFAGFAGRLDQTGSAVGTITIPQAVPRGTRFFVSFVTIGSGRILSVANTAGFTIR